MKSSRIFVKALVLSVSLIVAVFPADARKKAAAPQAPASPKYVFYMIGDGMGINEVRGAEIYNQATGNGPAEVNFFHFPVRTFVTTNSATSLVTDSAAAGTALATGVKTYNNAMGVGTDKLPLSNLTEWASAKGFGCGVASSVGVNHATPAAFYAHTDDRNSYEVITEQLIAAGQISFAAGSALLNEKRKTGHDSAYLENMVKEAGIAVVYGKEGIAGTDMAALQQRVLCLDVPGGTDDLTPAINRRGGETELTDFVKAGIDYLYGHFAEKGFFFMIEGGAIDHAGHNDDAASDFWEINDFAKSIDAVLAFYEQHPDETLIVITADHETGGMMLGAGQYEMNPSRLSAQKYDQGYINNAFRKLSENGNVPTWEDVQGFFKEYLGIGEAIRLRPDQMDSLKAMYDRQFGRNEGEETVKNLYSSNSRIVAEAMMLADKAAGYGWSFGCHSGSPVGLYAKGCRACDFLKCTDNTDIPKMIRTVAGY